MEQSFKEGGRSSPQTVMDFNQVAPFADDGKNQSRKRKRKGTFINFKKLETPPDNDFEIDGECFFQIADDNELINCLFPFVDEFGNEPLECFLNLPDKSLMENSLLMSNIKWHQDQCQELQ